VKKLLGVKTKKSAFFNQALNVNIIWSMHSMIIYPVKMPTALLLMQKIAMLV